VCANKIQIFKFRVITISKHTISTAESAESAQRSL